MSERSYIGNIMTPSKTKKSFSDIMIEGLTINRQSQEGDAVYYTDKEYLDKVFIKYQFWKSQIRDFLTNAKQDLLEWHKFYESDSVSLFKGGMEYGDISSPKSQELLRNIRIESSAKLNLLKQLGDVLFKKQFPKVKINNEDKIEIRDKENYFSFNKITGDTMLNGTKTNFKIGQQKYTIINTLVSTSNNQSSYDDICESLGWTKSVSTKRNMQNLIKEIKEDLKILPKGKKSNIDIFKNIENFGYRLLLK
jgi:hypothetical protein